MKVIEMRIKGLQNILTVTKDFNLYTNLIELTKCYYLVKGRLRMLNVLELISDDEYFKLYELVTNCMIERKNEIEK